MWTNQAGTPVASATAISGYVSSAPTTPSVIINGPQPRSVQPPGQGITAYWTFMT